MRRTFLIAVLCASLLMLIAAVLAPPRLRRADVRPPGIIVTRAVDGDTLEVSFPDGTAATVRVIGIDTPETVHPSRPVQCFGREASDRMRALAEGRAVTLEAKPGEDADAFGRLLRYVAVEGEDVGARLLREGYAFSYRRYPHDRRDTYDALERAAREGKLGLWGDACGYAASSSAPAASGPGGCTIKGNVSGARKLYHLPGCGTYARTSIDTTKGERWFCTEQEAQAAGWTKAGNCP